MIIASVNSYEITDKEYKVELIRMMKNMLLEQPSQECKKRALECLIDGVLLLSEARKADITVSQDEIENELLDLMLTFDSEDEFQYILEQQQLNEATLRKRIRDNIIIEKYIYEKFKESNETYTDDILRDFYEKNKDKFATREMVKASHILVRNESGDAEEKANKIRTQLHTKEDFNNYAVSISDCPSCDQAGDLGYFGRGKMVKEIEDAAFSMAIDEISEPIKTTFGYHIIMVTDRKDSKTADFENIKDALRKRLHQIDSELNLLNHLKQLRVDAEIDIESEAIFN